MVGWKEMKGVTESNGNSLLSKENSLMNKRHSSIVA